MLRFLMSMYSATWIKTGLDGLMYLVGILILDLAKSPVTFLGL